MEHRTQIYLGDHHYLFLKERAERDGSSLAQIIRDLIEKAMPSEKTWVSDPVWSLPKAGFRSGEKHGSRNHHEMLRKLTKHRRSHR